MSTIIISNPSLIIHGETLTPLKSAYDYTSLPAHGWIRILALHPGSARDKLTCGLQHRKVDDAEASGFEAVSYVWGGSNGPEVLVEVQCDDSIILIGENLACALRHIRHDIETRFLWVDAVCIDQENIEERSTQVRQMGEIYASASRVLIWLGPDNNQEAHECFKLIQETTTTLIDMASRHGEISLIPPIPPQTKIICSDSQKWDMVQRLMELEWFERVWVLLEVGLARSAVLLYGNAALNWACLVELMLIVASRADVSSLVGNIKSGMIWDFYEDLWRSYGNAASWRNEMPLTRSLNSNESQASFINILNDGRAYKATDQRDRVYAFLSHPSAASGVSKEERLVIADYHLSVDQVYLDTAGRILENDPNPWTVLTCVDHATDSLSLGPKRPSWVPRWDDGWRVYWLGYPEMWYRAGGNDSAAFRFELSKTDSALKLCGIILDPIAWTSRVFDSDELRLEPQQQHAPLQQLWQELQRRDSDNTVYGSSIEDREHAFSLVLAAGRAVDEGPAEDDAGHHQAIYQAYKTMVSSGGMAKPHVATPSEARNDDIQTRQEDQKAIELEALTYIGSSQRRALHNRRFFRTSKGYYGIAHREVRIGDLCSVFRGANMPFVMRSVEVAQNDRELSTRMSDRYVLVSEAYVQGVMRGEIFEGMESLGSDPREQTIVIV